MKVSEELPIFSKRNLNLNGSISEKKQTNAIPLIILFIVMILTVNMVRSKLSNHKESLKIQVVGAGEDLTPNTKIGFSHLHYVTIPQKFFNENMFTSSDMVAGRILKNYIRIGEPILKNNLYPLQKSLSHKLTKNEIAFTLKLNDESLLNNSIMENDRVDVILVGSLDDKKIAKTICQNIKVLSSPEKCLSSNSRNIETDNLITLAVSANQAQILALASQTGEITLCLRNQNSSINKNLKSLSQYTLLDEEAKNNPENNKNINMLVPPPVPTSIAINNQPNTENTTQSDEQDSKQNKWYIEKYSGNTKEDICINPGN